MKNTIPRLAKVFDIWNDEFSAYNEQYWRRRVRSISMGRRATYYDQLDAYCRRNVSNWCRIKRYCSVECRSHRWRHISVDSTKSLRRERKVPHQHRVFLFSSDGWENLLYKEQHEKTGRRKRCTVGPISQGKPRVKQYQQKSDHTKITSFKKATVIATAGRWTGPEQWSPQEERSQKNWARENSRILTHSWFGRWISRLKFVLTTVHQLDLWFG